MRIDIGEKYCVTSDPNQFKVNQRSIPPKLDAEGEEVLKTIGYLPSVNSCYKFLLKHQILISKACGFKEVMEEVARIEKEIDESIRI